MKGLPETLLGAPLVEERAGYWSYALKDAGSNHAYATIHIIKQDPKRQPLNNGQYKVSAMAHGDPSENWSATKFFEVVARNKFTRKIDSVLKAAILAIEAYYVGEAATARTYAGKVTKKASTLAKRVELLASLRPTIWDRLDTS